MEHWRGGGSRELKRAVLAQTGLPEQALGWAFDQYVAQNAKDWYTAKDRANILEWARAFADAAPNGARPVAARKTPTQQVTALELQKAIGRTVEEVRQRVFGGSSAPFNSWEAAADWLQSEADRQVPRTELEERRREELEGQLFAVLRNLNELGARYTLDETTWPLRGLWYRRSAADDPVELRAHRDPLLSLQLAVLRIEDATGMYGASILRYVLTGESPVFPRAAVRLEPQTSVLRVGDTPTGLVRRSRVILTLNTPDFKLQELRDLAKAVVGVWGDRRGSDISEDMQELHEVVLQLGGPGPGDWGKGGTVPRAWWRTVEREWARRHPDAPKSAEALRVMYLRFVQRFRESIPRWTHTPRE